MSPELVDGNRPVLLITGSRSIDALYTVTESIHRSPWSPSRVVHGGAEGVDTLAGQYADTFGFDVEVHPIPEWVWDHLGRRAGPIRNQHMVDQADAVLAIWDGESPGTKDTIDRARASGVPVYVVVWERAEAHDAWQVVDTEYHDDDQVGLDHFEASDT